MADRFGEVRVSVSPNKREGALILQKRAAEKALRRIGWMQADPDLGDVIRALNWVVANTGEKE